MTIKFYTERGIAPNGAQVEMGFVVHNGTEFCALGSVVDHAQGVVVGYVCGNDGEYVLQTWEGDREIAKLRLLATYQTYPPGASLPVVMECYRAVIDGRVYSGRKSRGNMLLRLRASEPQREGSK